MEWKVSLQIIAKKSIDKLLSTSIEKGLISYEKELTMNFVRYIFVGKIRLVIHYNFRMVMEKKKSSSIPTFDGLLINKNTYAYIYVHIVSVIEMKSS